MNLRKFAMFMRILHSIIFFLATMIYILTGVVTNICYLLQGARDWRTEQSVVTSGHTWGIPSAVYLGEILGN